MSAATPETGHVPRARRPLVLLLCLLALPTGGSAQDLSSAFTAPPPSIGWSGILLGADAAITVPVTDPDRGYRIGWTASVGRSSVSRAEIHDLSGHDSVSVGVGDPSGGSIALRTASDPVQGFAAEGNVVLHAGQPDSATIYGYAFSPPGAGNGVTQYAYGGHGTGIAFLALVTDGGHEAATAYGAYSDAQGFQFIGTGNLRRSLAEHFTEKSVTLEESRLVLYFPKHMGDGAALRPQISLFHRSADWSMSNALTLHMFEGGHGTYGIPDISMSEDTNGTFDALGIGLGFSAERQIDDQLALGMDVSAGPEIYHGEQQRRKVATFGTFGTTTFGQSHATFDGVAVNLQAGANLIFHLRPNVDVAARIGMDADAALTGGARLLDSPVLVSPKLSIGMHVRF